MALQGGTYLLDHIDEVIDSLGVVLVVTLEIDVPRMREQIRKWGEQKTYKMYNSSSSFTEGMGVLEGRKGHRSVFLLKHTRSIPCNRGSSRKRQWQ